MRITLSGSNLTFNIPQLEELNNRVEDLMNTLKIITKKEKQIMATLEELQAKADLSIQKVDALNTALDGYRALVAQMKAELDALKVGDVLAPAVQAKVDAISASLDVEVAKIDETYNENFPAAEVPPDQV
jgi:chromosome segregation ATPase